MHYNLSTDDEVIPIIEKYALAILSDLGEDGS